MTNSPKAQAEAMAGEIWSATPLNEMVEAFSAALEKLLTENERLKAEAHSNDCPVVDERDALQSQLTATEAKLSRVTTSGWLKHAPGCAEFIPLYGCRCGLTDFLSTTAAKKEEAK